jgi:hypothetical protein
MPRTIHHVILRDGTFFFLQGIILLFFNSNKVLLLQLMMNFADFIIIGPNESTIDYSLCCIADDSYPSIHPSIHPTKDLDRLASYLFAMCLLTKKITACG